jgi:hypothetical protein
VSDTGRVPTSIDQIPGFELLQGWLHSEFSGIKGELARVSDKVDCLTKTIDTDIRTQVTLNTAFRVECQDSARGLKNARRAAWFAFLCSAVVFIANLVLSSFGKGRPT